MQNHFYMYILKRVNGSCYIVLQKIVKTARGYPSTRLRIKLRRAGGRSLLSTVEGSGLAELGTRSKHSADWVKAEEKVKISLFFTLIISFCFSLIMYADDHKTILGVIIMVKDEADVIIPTLQPFVDAGVSAFLVYDTGSKDHTPQIAQDYFTQCGIEHGYIIEEPFIDFAASRNRLLDLAEELFPQVTFFIMLDAEWYTYNVDELIRYCEKHKDYIAPGQIGGCYAIRLVTMQDGIDNYTPRLIRNGKNVRYAGVVHESIEQKVSDVVPGSVYFEYAPTQSGRNKSQARCIRDYALLKKDHEKNPTNSRTVFYLAQTCQFLDDWQQAIFYYQKRAEMGVISEEKYLALYRIGCAIDYLIDKAEKENADSPYRWEDALRYYLEAHAMLSHRAEPLVRMAHYYLRHNQHAIAFLFAHRAMQLPYPVQDVLFVEKNAYDYLRYDIVGQCALYVQEYEIGKNAVLKALKAAPHTAHLYHNLEVYLPYSV